jgi:hypothetical protein
MGSWGQDYTMGGFLICMITIKYYSFHYFTFISISGEWVMVMVSRDQEQCLSWLCLSDRFVGNLLKGQTVGVIGAGRIGSAYARMMVIPYFL